MAWPKGAPAVGVDTQDRDWLIQFWEAIRERAHVVDGPVNSVNKFWPPHNEVWDYGTITNVVGNVITDSVKVWPVSRWAGGPDPDVPVVPDNYDLVVCDDADVWNDRKIVTFPIVSSDASSLTVNPLDWVERKVITSLVSLIGRPYWIIMRGGYFWHDRWPERCDATIWDFGTIAASGSSYLVDTDKGWRTNQWTGKDVIWFRNNYIFRRAITGNTGTELDFDGTGISSSGLSSDYPEVTQPYAIIEADEPFYSQFHTTDLEEDGGVLYRLPQPFPPWAWYRGYFNDTYYTNKWNDETAGPSTTMLPSDSITIERGIDCDPDDVPAFDEDPHKDILDECPTADTFYAPHVWKTFRGLQRWIEGECDSFVPEKSYDGETAINMYSPPTLFYELGLNAIKTTISSHTDASNCTLSGTLVVNAEVTATTIPVTYALEDDRGRSVGFRAGELTNGNQLHDGAGGANLADYDGWVIYVSAGWDRFFAREFLYMYDRTWFRTDASGPGTWVTKPKSTHYREYGPTGMVTQDGPEFIDGSIARFTGDNLNDPGLDPAAVGAEEPLDYLRGWVGEFHEAQQNIFNAAKRGTVTSGRKDMLRDSTKNWWAIGAFDNVSNAAETGTAQFGSNSTTLVDATKIGNVKWDPATGRWENFILEITHSGVTHFTPITVMDEATGTLTFKEITGLTVVAGDTYQIREPTSELNRWKGRTVRITKENHTTFDVVITHSDDTHLYFDALSFPIEAGWTYEIIDARPGTVWQYRESTAEWIVPTGTDPRTGQIYGDQLAIPTDVVHRAGRMMKGDYMCLSFFNDIYRAINKLVWTKGPAAWSARGEVNAIAPVDSSTEDAYYNPTYDPGTPYTFDVQYADVESYVAAVWAAEIPYAIVDGDGPDAGAGTFSTGSYIPPDNDAGEVGTSGMSRMYAYIQVDGVLATIFDCEVDFFAMAGLPADADEVLTPTAPDFAVRKFDAMDSGFLFRKWRYLGTDSTDSPHRELPDKWGGDIFTNPPTLLKPHDALVEDHPGMGGFTAFNGFSTINQLTIWKWNVGGGFTYVA